MKYLYYLSIFGLLLLFSCGNETQENNKQQSEPTDNSNAIISFTIDGKTRSISQKERVEDTIDFSTLPIKTLFRKGGENREFEINLNIYDAEILNKLPATFTIPDANIPKVTIDLNFFDLERKVEKSMQKRLIFEKGNITIHEFSPQKIRFDFEGEAHELMNTTSRSTVSGWVKE